MLFVQSISIPCFLCKALSFNRCDGVTFSWTYTEPLQIRPYQDVSKLYLSAERFKEFFPNRGPDFAGGSAAH